MALCQFLQNNSMLLYMIQLNRGKPNPVKLKEEMFMTSKKTDKHRTHAPNVDDKTPNPNKSDRYILKDVPKPKDRS